MRPRELTVPALFAALIGVLGYVSIPLPFSPVPVTGQSLGVMLAGAILSPRQAGLSMLAFIFLGSIGAPVFAGGAAGIGVLAGPTGGYIVGFALGAVVIALLRGRSLTSLVTAVIIGGLVVVYIPGVIWLSKVTGLDIRAASAGGILPYLPGDVLKAAMAVTAASKLSAYTSRKNSWAGREPKLAKRTKQKG